ncbi:universal stress protein [Deinococcus oregonensis]|uniref:Universal stress protein n=1 Tax=Deinococcus oregonensis TaxID=1805970 RepID=A0ABV6AX91_9DEIO
MFEQLLVPLDSSPQSALALPVAADLARRYHSTVTLLYVLPALPVIYGEAAYAVFDSEAAVAAKEEGQRVLEEARTITASPDAQLLCLDAGEIRIAQTIVNVAEKRQSSMIVMGSHGRGGLEHFFLGSVAEGVMHRAGVPVDRAGPQREPDFPTQMNCPGELISHTAPDRPPALAGHLGRAVRSPHEKFRAEVHESALKSLTPSKVHSPGRHRPDHRSAQWRHDLQRFA